MSIELEVKLGTRTISRQSYRDSVAEEWRSRFPSDPIAYASAGPSESSVLGGSAAVFSFAVGDRALIECTCYSAGPVELLGEDGGWWVTHTVVHRTPESFMLMLIACVCMARALEASILDESCLLGKQRYVQYSEVLSELEQVSGKPLARASREICERFDMGFV